jgi:hypothetical protein
MYITPKLNRNYLLDIKDNKAKQQTKNQMKKSILLLLIAFIFIGASCQDKDFNKLVNANQGITTPFVQFPDGVLDKKPVTNYPSVGIAVSTGTAWAPSILDNSTNWNTAFSWGNHAGLYELKLGNPTVDGYVLTSTITGTRSWVPMTGGATMVYPPTGIPISNGNSWGTSITNNSTNWNTAYSWGPHDGLYRTITWVPTWNDILEKPSAYIPVAHTHDYNTDITDKPPEQELVDAILELDYLPIPKRTTEQINAIVMPPDGSGIVKDITLDMYKIYKNGTWNVFVITSD